MRRRALLGWLGGGIASATALGTGTAAAQAGGTEAWRFGTDGSVYAAPTVVDGTVYVGSDDWRLYAVDAATGEETWNFLSGDSIWGAPTVVDGTVYAGSFDGNLYAVDAATGEERWRFAVGERLLAAPTVADGLIYVGAEGGGLYAVAPAAGDGRWRFDAGGSIEAAPTVADETVYVGAGDGTLYAVDAVEGTERWRFEIGRSISSAPTVADGTVYVGAADGGLYAVDAATGTEEWRFDTIGAIGSAPTVANGTVYFGNLNGRLFAVAAADGTERWRFEAPEFEIDASPTVAGDTVYAGSRDATVYAVGADSGTERWRFETGELIRSAPTVVEGTVYVGSGDGNLYAVAAGVSGSSGGSRVRLGTLGHTGSFEPASLSATPTPTRTPTPDPTPTPTRTPARTRTGTPTIPSPTRTPLRTPSPTRAPTETPVPTGSGVGTAPATPTVSPGANTIVTGIPDLALGGGVLVALGGLAYGIASRTGDGDDPSGGSGPSPTTGGTPPDTGTGSGSDRPIDAAGGAGGPATSAPPAGTTPSVDSGHGGPPSSIPGAPELSLSFDDIEPGERLGAGGDADVYAAVVATPEGEQRVALKQPRFEGTLHEAAVERFAREAETWANLDEHDNVVGVVDWGTEPLPWLALEYMDGGDLGTIAGEVSLPQAAWTALGVVEGVRHAHTRGVAHLDLKPANVLLRETEGWSVPKVADWGLARLMLESSRSIEGLSPAYAAPEQFAEDRGEVGQATDIYQVGAVLYELFTGQPPYEGPPARVMNEVLSGEAPDPRAVAPDLPESVATVVTRAMAPDQDDRYEDVLYLRDDLATLSETL